MIEDSTLPDFSVVVPVFNSADILTILIDRLSAVFQQMEASYEVLLIDDCSMDNSWSTMISLREQFPETLRIFRLSRNFGQHNALMCGFKKCIGKYIVTIDDDLQNPPEEIPKMYDEMLNGNYDVVFGYFDDRKHSWRRNLTSNVTRWLIRRAISGISPHFSNYRLINAFTARKLAEQNDDFLYTDGLITWITHNTSYVHVRHDQRAKGQSNYNFKKLLRYFMTILYTFTTLPLTIVSFIGFVVAALGFLLGNIYFFMWLAGMISEPGFAAIILAILFLGGIQLIALGMIGEYVGKIFLKQSGKPQFVIRDEK